MYKIEYTPLAVKDMAEAVRYISKELSNPAAAGRLADEMVRVADRLADFPYANPVYYPIRPLKNEYRRLTVRNYLMLYSVDETKKNVTVFRVIYARRDYEKILE